MSSKTKVTLIGSAPNGERITLRAAPGPRGLYTFAGLVLGTDGGWRLVAKGYDAGSVGIRAQNAWLAGDPRMYTSENLPGWTTVRLLPGCSASDNGVSCTVVPGDHSPASNCPDGPVWHESADGYQWAAPETRGPAALDIPAIVDEATQGYSADQIEKAAALLEGGRIHPVPGLPGTFVAESSDATTRYLCDRFGACQCPCAAKTGRCYHGLAAKALDASTEAAA